jgi:uncharacterized protein YjbI with pentapeptide repeats
MVNKKHLEILKQGWQQWNKWRAENETITPNFRNADLRGADLSGVDLSGANLKRAYLEKANLSFANLSDADLSDASLVPPPPSEG